MKCEDCKWWEFHDYIEEIVPKILCYRGTPIEELSREELIGAVKILHKALQSSQDSHKQTLRIWELCREVA